MINFAANLLDQDFGCDGVDEKWGVDISYFWTADGWLYLAILLDLFSRRIIGWAVNDRLEKNLAIKALQRAIAVREPGPGLVHHSDRGSQYCSDDYQCLLKPHDMRPSMSGKGNCYDNAMVETVFKTIKSELVWRSSYQSRRHAKRNLLAITSMASIIREDDIPRSVTNRRSHSKPK